MKHPRGPAGEASLTSTPGATTECFVLNSWAPLCLLAAGVDGSGAAWIVAAVLLAALGWTAWRGARRAKALEKQLERERAEARKAQEEHRVIFDSVPAAITYKNAHNTILRVNKTRADLAGVPPEQLEGRTIFEVAPEFADQYHREDLDVIQSGQPKHGLIRPFVRANGETRWLLTDKIPYRDGQGATVGVIVFSIDITERKRTQEALQQAREELEKRVEERTEALSKAVNLLKQEIADRRQAEALNQAFSRLGQQLSAATSLKEAGQAALDAADALLGWDAAYIHLYTEDLQGTVPILIYDLMEGRRVAVTEPGHGLTARDRRILKHGAELAGGERGDSAEDSPHFGDVSRATVSRLFAPIHSGGKVIGAVSAQSYTANAYGEDDVSLLQSLADFCGGTLERIQAEGRLRQSEERFATMFRSSPIPMGLGTLAEGTFIDVNESVLEFLGFTREEMIGHTSLELGILQTPEDRQRLVEQVMKRNSVRNFECRMRTKTGAIRTVLASLERIEIPGGPTALLVAFHDITERMNLEEQLRQSQKMEAIGQLAAGVAHDFNNILTIITGHVGLLLDDEQTTEAARESLVPVANAADRAAALTRQLLAFSRKQVMELRATDLNDIVSDTANLLRRLLGENIVLSFNYCPTLPLIEADPSMIEQVIINLAVNARDAMPNGGQLTISAAPAERAETERAGGAERPEREYVCLTISDNGHGMDEETQARIFEPFFTTKEVGKGTGLGLATAYGIVKQHRGCIGLESAPGQGTTFRVFLPAAETPCAPAATVAPAAPETPASAEEEEEEETPAPAAKAAAAQTTILVVEDEEELRDLVRSLLVHYGYRVLEAEHGKAAMRVWDEQGGRVDLLLTDMMMPEGMSGIDLAEQFRKTNPGLKVIYTSGYSVDLFERRQVHGLREGLNFLPKPYQPETLAKTVRDCLAS